MGSPAREWTPEDDAQLRQLHADGATTIAMGLHFNIHRRTVEKRIKFLQLTRPRLNGRSAEWPEEKDARLTALWDDKTLSAADIGRQMGISKNAVVGRSHRLHLPSRPNPIKANCHRHGSPWPEGDDQLRQLWDAGHSISEIGRRMNLSKNAVVGRSHRIKLPSRPQLIRTAGSGNRAKAPPRPPVLKLATLESLRTPMLVQPTATVRAPEPMPVRSGPSLPCSYPIGEPRTPSFRYCDEPARVGSAYCDAHHRLCHVRVRAWEDAA